MRSLSALALTQRPSSIITDYQRLSQIIRGSLRQRQPGGPALGDLRRGDGLRPEMHPNIINLQYLGNGLSVGDLRDVHDMRDCKRWISTIEPAFIADLLRCELLHKFGNVYCDLDVIAVKNFKILLQSDPRFVWETCSTSDTRDSSRVIQARDAIGQILENLNRPQITEDTRREQEAELRPLLIVSHCGASYNTLSGGQVTPFLIVSHCGASSLTEVTAISVSEIKSFSDFERFFWSNPQISTEDFATLFRCKFSPAHDSQSRPEGAIRAVSMYDGVVLL